MALLLCASGQNILRNIHRPHSPWFYPPHCFGDGEAPVSHGHLHTWVSLLIEFRIYCHIIAIKTKLVHEIDDKAMASREIS